MHSLYNAVTLSKAAILGITLGALVILLMILLAAFRPHHPSPFPDGSLDKPDKSSNTSYPGYFFIWELHYSILGTTN
jgi:hypothetical protein